MTTGFAVLLLGLVLTGRAWATEVAQVRAYYFGNSLTGCTDPKDHEALAKLSAQRT